MHLFRASVKKIIAPTVVCFSSIYISVALAETNDQNKGKRSLCPFAHVASWTNMTLPAGHPTITNESKEESVTYNKSHYPNGLNGAFAGSCDQCMASYSGEKTESREVLECTDKIISMLKDYGLFKGSLVADIGAGSGILTKLLSREVGVKGTVYAEEISYGFLAMLDKLVKSEKLPNVVVVEGNAKSTNLPENNSLDLVLVCNTYHHFEYPRTVCKSIHRSLKAQSGRLVIIDFHRNDDLIKSKPKGWVMEHVRADRDVFISEIESAGFRLVTEPHVEGMVENYILVFQPI